MSPHLETRPPKKVQKFFSQTETCFFSSKRLEILVPLKFWTMAHLPERTTADPWWVSSTRKVLGFDEVQLCHAGALLRVQIPATVANRKKRHGRRLHCLVIGFDWLLVIDFIGCLIVHYLMLLVWLLQKLVGCYFLNLQGTVWPTNGRWFGARRRREKQGWVVTNNLSKKVTFSPSQKGSQRIARKAHYLWINVILVML